MDDAEATDVQIEIDYTNWKGVRAWRKIEPVSVWFGSTPQHSAPRWFLKARAQDRDGALRDFVTCNIHSIRYPGTASSAPAPELDLAVIEARAKAATHGPWRVSMTGYSVKSNEPDAPIIAKTPTQMRTATEVELWLNNGEFIAHARTDVPALIARVRELERALTQKTIMFEVTEEKLNEYIEKTVAAEARVRELESDLENARRKMNEKNG